MNTLLRPRLAAVAAASLLGGCGTPAAPEESSLTMSCRPSRLNTSRFTLGDRGEEHAPEQAVCTVTPFNVEVGTQVFVKVNDVAADAESVTRGPDVSRVPAGWAGVGTCEEGVELLPPGDTTLKVVDRRLEEGESALSFCFQCGEAQAGVTAVSAELFPDNTVKSAPVIVECFTRNPTSFKCEVRADSPQVSPGKSVSLTVNARDDHRGADVGNQMISVRTDELSSLEGSDTGEIRVVLVTDDAQGLANPVSPVKFTCPAVNGLYEVQVEFDDKDTNGDASCSTFVNCTDDEKTNFVDVASSEARLVADCESETTIAVVVKGPEGPVVGRDPVAPINVSMCANAGGVWQVEAAEDTLNCHECCDSCSEVFQDWEDCSRVTLEVDDTGLASAKIRAGRHPGTLIVAAEADLTALPYVQRNGDQFERGRLAVDGSVSVTQVGIGDIPFLAASPRLLGVKGSGFNEHSTVCFQVNDTVGTPFPAGVDVTFDIPNNAGGAAVVPVIVPTDASGQACTELQSGTVATTVSVRATVALGACGDAIVVQSVSTGIPIIGVKPSAGGFALDCDLRNVGALINNDGLNALVQSEQLCATQLKDRFGNPIGLSTAVSYRAEAGVIGGTVNTIPLDIGGDPTQPQPNVGKARVTYGTFGVLPKDVDPFNAGEVQGTDREPRRLLGGRTYNPRDGLVAIIAYVSGEEQFTDTDGDGEYDIGEPFVDLPEPFLDYDDNNLRGADEPFIDIDLQGNVLRQHDGPNNQWDGATIIWTETRVMWTGAPYDVQFAIDLRCTDRANSVDCGFGDNNHYKIDAGQSCAAVAVVRDQNLNLVNCTTSYQWTASGGTLVDPDLANVDCVTGLGWGFLSVPSGTPNVTRRRTRIGHWGEFTDTRVGANAASPSRLADLDRTGMFFDTSLVSTTAPAEAGGEELPYDRSTLELDLTWSTAPGAGQSWTRSWQLRGCIQ